MSILTNELLRQWWVIHHNDAPPQPILPYTEKAGIIVTSGGANNNTHWIDTGLTHSIDDTWEVVTKCTAANASKSPIGTGVAKDDGSNFCIWLHTEASPYYAEFVFGYGSNADYKVTAECDVSSIHTYKMKLSTR